jgi:hypothetical protein
MVQVFHFHKNSVAPKSRRSRINYGEKVFDKRGAN